MIIMSASTNSHIWGENVYKRDKILGKFKKDPPHIGEYEKSAFSGRQIALCSITPLKLNTYKNII